MPYIAKATGFVSSSSLLVSWGVGKLVLFVTHDLYLFIYHSRA